MVKTQLTHSIQYTTKKSSTTDACQGLEYAYNGKYDDY